MHGGVGGGVMVQVPDGDSPNTVDIDLAKVQWRLCQLATAAAAAAAAAAATATA